MADDTRFPFEKGQLRLEATEWFVLLRGPEAEQHRAQFERWLARGALHRAAYNRVAHLYAAGKQVDWGAVPGQRRVSAARIALFACLAIAGFVGWRIVVPSAPLAGQGRGGALAISEQEQQYASRLGEVRVIDLPDGSLLTLDTDTLVLAQFGTGARNLRLEHGRARFTVAHERRPFTVHAGSSEIKARGTVFDVSFTQDREVHVQLLKGAVDVRRRGPDGRVDTTSISPGEGVRYRDADAASDRVLPRPDAGTTWPTGVIEWHAASLTEVVETANRYSSTKIILARPELSRIKVSGTFRVDDAERLASSLAQLLALRIEHAPGRLTLSERAD